MSTCGSGIPCPDARVCAVIPRTANASTEILCADILSFSILIVAEIGRDDRNKPGGGRITHFAVTGTLQTNVSHSMRSSPLLPRPVRMMAKFSRGGDAV